LIHINAIETLKTDRPFSMMLLVHNVHDWMVLAAGAD